MTALDATLIVAVAEKIGTEIASVNSWIGSGETEQDLEILMGNTGRKESTEASRD